MANVWDGASGGICRIKLEQNNKPGSFNFHLTDYFMDDWLFQP